MIDKDDIQAFLAQVFLQNQFAALIGVSPQAVSALFLRGTLKVGEPVGAWLLAYCENLREVAAGRQSAGGGDLDLVQERARLAKEQADRVAMNNAQLRRELAPVALMEVALAKVGRQISGVLEAIPVTLKRGSVNFSAEDLRLVNAEIIKARNMAAAIELNLDDLKEMNDETLTSSDQADTASD